MRNSITFDNYHNNVEVNHRKTDITSKELKALQEKKEYNQALSIGFVVLTILTIVAIIACS
jgi:hypothetical protein